MARIKLSTSKRSELGRSAVKRLRGVGVIPGVVYGKGEDSIPVEITGEELHNIKASQFVENALLDLVIKDDGKKKTKTVIIKEVQRDCINGSLLHVDFNTVSLTERLKAKVRIKLVGDSVGAAQGGVLEHLLHELEIECLPSDIPEHIDIDITNLEIGHHICVKDMSIPDKVTVLGDLEQPVVAVAVPKEEEEPVPAEGAVEGEAGPEEPEVIAKGKKEEEGEGEAGEGEAKGKAKGKEEKKPEKK